MASLKTGKRNSKVSRNAIRKAVRDEMGNSRKVKYVEMKVAKKISKKEKVKSKGTNIELVTKMDTLIDNDLPKAIRNLSNRILDIEKRLAEIKYIKVIEEVPVEIIKEVEVVKSFDFETLTKMMKDMGEVKVSKAKGQSIALPKSQAEKKRRKLMERRGSKRNEK